MKERLPGLVVFQVPQDHAVVADLFRTMERGKKIKVKYDVNISADVLIDDYSINQTSLDQVGISNNFVSMRNHTSVRCSSAKCVNGNCYQLSFSVIPMSDLSVFRRTMPLVNFQLPSKMRLDGLNKKRTKIC